MCIIFCVVGCVELCWLDGGCDGGDGWVGFLSQKIAKACIYSRGYFAKVVNFANSFIQYDIVCNKIGTFFSFRDWIDAHVMHFTLLAC